MTQGLGDFKFWKVKGKIALTSPHLGDWLPLSKLYAGRKIKVGDSITVSCGLIMIAAVIPEEILNYLKLKTSPHLRKIVS